MSRSEMVGFHNTPHHTLALWVLCARTVVDTDRTVPEAHGVARLIEINSNATAVTE